mmetsp:Transcript_18875/g.39108  ORF Transcript_18875/g.39108 Transcript_18875/m.39108 type:complete len:292 (+) Transcript_18875:2423-3298(+)
MAGMWTTRVNTLAKVEVIMRLRVVPRIDHLMTIRPLVDEVVTTIAEVAVVEVALVVAMIDTIETAVMSLDRIVVVVVAAILVPTIDLTAVAEERVVPVAVVEETVIEVGKMMIEDVVANPTIEGAEARIAGAPRRTRAEVTIVMTRPATNRMRLLVEVAAAVVVIPTIEDAVVEAAAAVIADGEGAIVTAAAELDHDTVAADANVSTLFTASYYYYINLKAQWVFQFYKQFFFSIRIVYSRQRQSLTVTAGNEEFINRSYSYARSTFYFSKLRVWIHSIHHVTVLDRQFCI